MKNNCRAVFYFLLPLILISLTSCIGISADIQMRRDGSGRLRMEYRFSRIAENIGRLDGNERWNIIPTGRTDIERTAARIDGLRLISFSSRNDANDILNNAALEFQNAQALLNFLDPSGRRASIIQENGSNRLRFIFNEAGSTEINHYLMALMRQSAAGYRLSISFRANGQSSLITIDGNGNEIPPPPAAEIIAQGRRVLFAIDMGELLALENGLGVEISY